MSNVIKINKYPRIRKVKDFLVVIGFLPVAILLSITEWEGATWQGALIFISLVSTPFLCLLANRWLEKIVREDEKARKALRSLPPTKREDKRC